MIKKRDLPFGKRFIHDPKQQVIFIAKIEIEGCIRVANFLG